MLISVTDLKKYYPKFAEVDDVLLERKLRVIESSIRKYTNNKFYNTLVKFTGSIVDGVIQTSSPYLKVGDTIEVVESLNKGLYTISEITDTSIKIDGTLYDTHNVEIIKVEYPIDVVEGAIELLNWELIEKGKEKSGIASESISRHNVSYVQRTGDNTINGYPVELFNFCTDYMVMRT